ncbi:ion transport protein [Plasmodium falciparum Dd2]|uniref:Ion transport protein n=1 Tax=Plasmodium falciparum (isolate Dd2) TaxID=57267 RepID=A0A0L7LYL2_PLAF4|nr:ion transport protein [Plasmodium falciparum Dd2]
MNNDNIGREPIDVVYDKRFSSRIKPKTKKKKRNENRMRLVRIQHYIYNIFTSFLCLFIVILILYASIDISINYGPVIILYILILELGSMLISYILLQFPFFYRKLKNTFMRARNINKYSHQYRPLYYDNNSFTDENESFNISDDEKKEKRKRKHTYSFMSSDGGRKRSSFRRFLSSYKSKKGNEFVNSKTMKNKTKKNTRRKGFLSFNWIGYKNGETNKNRNDNIVNDVYKKYNDDNYDDNKYNDDNYNDDDNKYNDDDILNSHSEQDQRKKKKKKKEKRIVVFPRNDTGGNSFKRESIYIDDCNMWMKKTMRKSNRPNFKLTRSLSFNINMNKDDDLMMKDSASLDNIQIFLGHRSSKFLREKNKLQKRKTSIYNKYVPLTFASSYKDDFFKEILKSQTDGIISSSSDYSSSSEDSNKNVYKTIYINNNNNNVDKKGKIDEEDNIVVRNNIHSNENIIIKENPYSLRNAILFHKEKRKYRKNINTLSDDDNKNFAFHSGKKKIKRKEKKRRCFIKLKCFNKIKNLYRFFINYNMKSSKSSNNLYLFFRGFYIYTKHRFVHYLSYEPIWIVAILIRIVLWCIVWIWAASYMERKPKNFEITEWNMKNVPSFYGYIECTFQWCGVFDYFFGLYFSNNKLKYIFSFFSLIDFITTPVSSLIMNFFVQDNINHNYWFLILGPLRFLRLVRAESTISSCFFWLNDVKIIIIGIIILALAILFTFSGIMYILEAPDIERDFVKPLDFVYFGVITMSTVGYGDYTPVTKAGKFLTMFIIITCISFVAAQFKRLKEAMFSPKTVMGIIPKQDDDYILILGPVSPTQLLYICKGINNSFPNSVESIFLFTPLPVVIYRYVYGSIVKNTNIKICISGGNECFICPSIIYDAVINSRALYILNNVDSEKYTLMYQQIFLASNNINFNNHDHQNQRISSDDILHNNIINKYSKDKTKNWKYSDLFSEYKNEINKNNMLNLEMNININNSYSIKEKDDQECLLRFIGTYNICNSLIPITLQLSNNTYEELIKSMNVYNYISIEELKYALLAKSVNCKGLFFLIINFFYKPKAVKSLKKYIIDLKLLMYNGMLRRKNRERLSSSNLKIKQPSQQKSRKGNLINKISLFFKKGQNHQLDAEGISHDEKNNSNTSRTRGNNRNDHMDPQIKGKGVFEMNQKEQKQVMLKEGMNKNMNKNIIKDMEKNMNSNGKDNINDSINESIEKNDLFFLNSLDPNDDRNIHNLSYKNYYYMLEKVNLNMYYYLEGLKYNIYRFQFPECMRGFLFQTASEYLYQKYSAFLIGIITINKEIFLNPVNYIIGEENKYFYTSAFSGIILTTSLDSLIKLSSINNISKKVYEYNKRLIEEKYKSTFSKSWINSDDDHHNSDHKNFVTNTQIKETQIDGDEVKIVLTSHDDSLHPSDRSVKNRKNSMKSIYNQKKSNLGDQKKKNRNQDDRTEHQVDDNNDSDYLQIESVPKKKRNMYYSLVLGICELENYISAYKDAFVDKDKPLLLVCGWPDNIHMFFKYLKRNVYNSSYRNKNNSNIHTYDNNNNNNNNNNIYSKTVKNKKGKRKKMKKLNDDIKYNIIILSLHVPKFNYENDLFNYSENVVFIRGSPLNSYNLIQAGVFYAKRIIILNSNHSLFIDKDAYRIDNEVIIIKNIVNQLFNYISKNKENYFNLLRKTFPKEYIDITINERIFLNDNINNSPNINEMIKGKMSDSSYDSLDDNYSSDDDSSSSNYDDDDEDNDNDDDNDEDNVDNNNDHGGESLLLKKKRKKKNMIKLKKRALNVNNIFNINKNPYLICLIKNSESLEYIDGSINLSYENYNDNEKMNKIWENCGEYIYTFELVSANIFVHEMLHNLVSFSLPISKYAIEYSVIYSLIGIDINEYSKNAQKFHKNLNLSTGYVNLVPIPSYFYKKSFYKCFSYFLHNKLSLCIGILRYIDISSLSHKSQKIFVLSCPSRAVKVEPPGPAYVIAHRM